MLIDTPTSKLVTSARLGRTRSICLLVAVLGASLLPVSVLADGQAQGFHMQAIEDRDEGALILHQRFDAARHRNRTWAQAIRENSDPERVFPFAVSNNLCVAYTMSGPAASAGPYCDAAVVAAQAQVNFDNRALERDHEHWAIALSNRGVQRALAGDQQGARVDFQQALDLQGEDSLATENLNRLNQATDQFVRRGVGD